MNAVSKVIFPGVLRNKNGVLVEAHSTSTLVTSEDHIIVVDTSSPQFRPLLLDGLRRLGVDPLKVDMVVNTHLHHDHCSNNDLFPNATFYARVEEDPSPGMQAVREDTDLCLDVRLVHTPGHTRGSMSVVVRAPDGVHVVAGDAVPTRENFEQWVPPMIRFDESVALDSMRRIADMAAVIVPGHGPAFRTYGKKR